MERRKFLGTLPYAVGGTLAAGSLPSHAQVQTQSAANYVSVKSFGAVGDGVTDDTAALQAAINASAGKSLFFPDGIYRISAALAIATGIELIGAGSASVTISQSAPSTGVFWINCGSNILTGIALRGFTLDNNGGGSGSCYGVDQSVLSGGTVYNLSLQDIVVASGLPGGVRLRSVYYGVIEHVVVDKVGLQDGGLVLRGVDAQSKIVNVRVQNLSVRSGNGGYGIYIGSHAEGLQFFMCLLESSGLATSVNIVNDLGAPRPPENLFFSQVICDSPQRNGLVINGCYSANFVDCWFASATGPAANAVGHGIYVLSGNEIVFNACRILNNANDGARIDAGGQFVKFMGCSVYSNGTSGANTCDGIAFRPGASDFEVLGCNFARANTIPSQRYSVSVFHGVSDRYIISNNLMGGAVTSGLFDGGTGANKAIGGNVLAGP